MSESKFLYPKTEKLTGTTEAAGGDVTTIVAGPHRDRTIVHMDGFHSGGGGSDHSTAWLELIVDGAVLGRAEDSHFNTYNLHISRDIFLSAGAQVTISVRGGNSGADTWRMGVEGRATSLWP